MKKTPLSKIWSFLTEGIWDIEPESVHGVRRFGLKVARIVHMVLRGFRDDECPLHASALTFSSLMAIVPVLALSLALAKGFGDTDIARIKAKDVVGQFTERIRENDPGTNALLGVTVTNAPAEQLSGSKLAEEIEGLVDKGFDNAENISFTAIGGLGLAVLLWMVIDVLSRVESSFNKVWGVTRGRSILRKFTDYIFAVLVLPFLIVLASSLPVAEMVARLSNPDTAEHLQDAMGSPFLKNLTVMGLMSLAFTFLIMFMPNTKISLRAGLTGGVVSGILFVMWISICAAIQAGAVRSGKIYGSFAVVPILLAWVYVSWEIILLGAESAFALQNYRTYRKEQRSRRASFNARLVLALCVVAEAARKMLAGAGSLDVSDFAVENRIPVRFLNDVVDELVRQGYLGALADSRGHFTLLRSPSEIKVQEVADAFVYYGEEPARLGIPKSRKQFAPFHDLADSAIKRSVGDAVFADIVAGHDSKTGADS